MDGLKVAMVGDLRYGRTVHSLTKLLLHFDISLRFVSPEILRMPLSIMNEVIDAGVDVRETHDVADVIENADVLYVTRVQKERFSDMAQYEEVKDMYEITPELMEEAKEKMVIMHPLPRVGEIHYAVDQRPPRRLLPPGAERDVHPHGPVGGRSGQSIATCRIPLPDRELPSLQDRARGRIQALCEPGCCPGCASARSRRLPATACP